MPMSEVYAYRENGKLMAVGTIAEIAQVTGMTKRQIARRMRGDTDGSIVDVSPNRRDRRSMKARDLTCGELRDKGMDKVQIQRLMGMTKAMVEAALTRVDSGRYDDLCIDSLDIDVSAEEAVSALSHEKRDEIRDMVKSALLDAPSYWAQ